MENQCVCERESVRRRNSESKEREKDREREEEEKGGNEKDEEAVEVSSRFRVVTAAAFVPLFWIGVTDAPSLFAGFTLVSWKLRD